MTDEQKFMLKNSPARLVSKKSIVTKKRALITLGVIAGGAAAYYIGPRILAKVQVK